MITKESISPSMLPPVILTRMEMDQHHISRVWQGVPSIELMPNGKMYCTFFSGGCDEGPNNFLVMYESTNYGKTWSDDPVLCIKPIEKARCFDPCLWLDPLGRLWWFWSQAFSTEGRGAFDGKYGLWCIRFDDPCVGLNNWTAPRRLCDGSMINKPTVLSTGEWLYPISTFDHLELPGINREKLPRTNIFLSINKGNTLSLHGVAEIPDRDFDEAMIIEKQNNTLWLLARTKYGIAECFSSDGGKTWSRGTECNIPGPCSRFHIRRLNSGRLLLVNHHHFINKGYEDFLRKQKWGDEFHILWALRRRNITAMLSDDDGKTWPHMLLLDERERVSYPDAVESEAGQILIVYDRDRYGEGEILLASLTEEDICKGYPISDQSFLKHLISRIDT